MWRQRSAQIECQKRPDDLCSSASHMHTPEQANEQDKGGKSLFQLQLFRSALVATTSLGSCAQTLFPNSFKQPCCNCSSWGFGKDKDNRGRICNSDQTCIPAFAATDILEGEGRESLFDGEARMSFRRHPVDQKGPSRL